MVSMLTRLIVRADVVSEFGEGYNAVVEYEYEYEYELEEGTPEQWQAHGGRVSGQLGLWGTRPLR